MPAFSFMNTNPNWHEATADAVDNEWLDAIGKRWVEMTGHPWETRDGETRQEGVEANVQALFNELDPVRTKEHNILVRENRALSAELNRVKEECATQRAEAIRKSAETIEARRKLESASALFLKALSYSGHSNSCHCRDEEDESCTCGYTKFAKEARQF